MAVPLRRVRSRWHRARPGCSARSSSHGVGRLDAGFILDAPSHARRHHRRHLAGADGQPLADRPDRRWCRCRWASAPRSTSRSTASARSSATVDRDRHRQPGRRALDHLRHARPRPVRPRAWRWARPMHGRRADVVDSWCCPIVIMSSREALRTVKDALREAALGLGATRWQTTRHIVLPMALPGILTGAILAVSRAIGETAPLVVVGAFAYISVRPRWPRRRLHRAADADLPVDLEPASASLPDQRRGRHRGPDVARCSCSTRSPSCPAQPLPETACSDDRRRGWYGLIRATPATIDDVDRAVHEDQRHRPAGLLRQPTRC